MPWYLYGEDKRRCVVKKRACQKRYNASTKGHKVNDRYEGSEKRRDSHQRYLSTTKGILNSVKSNQAFLASRREQ